MVFRAKRIAQVISVPTEIEFDIEKELELGTINKESINEKSIFCRRKLKLEEII